MFSDDKGGWHYLAKEECNVDDYMWKEDKFVVGFIILGTEGSQGESES